MRVVMRERDVYDYIPPVAELFRRFVDRGGAGAGANQVPGKSGKRKKGKRGLPR